MVVMVMVMVELVRLRRARGRLLLLLLLLLLLFLLLSCLMFVVLLRLLLCLLVLLLLLLLLLLFLLLEPLSLLRGRCLRLRRQGCVRRRWAAQHGQPRHRQLPLWRRMGAQAAKRHLDARGRHIRFQLCHVLPQLDQQGRGRGGRGCQRLHGQ
jgi:hypothetical protein